jgi:hypothetical protein
MQPLASSDRIAQKMADGRPMRIEAAEFITAGYLPWSAWKSTAGAIGIALWILSMTTSRGCAPYSASKPSIGCHEPISRIALRNHSPCVIWARASRVGCNATRSMQEKRLP